VRTYFQEILLVCFELDKTPGKVFLIKEVCLLRACPQSHFFQNSFLDHENVNNFSENIQAFSEKCQLSEQL